GQPERVVLVHERVVARFGATRFRLRHAAELWSRQAIERPALGTMLASRVRAVEWTFAFAAGEARPMPAGERHPDNAFAVDVHAARRVAGERHLVDFRQRMIRVIAWIETHHHAGEAEHRSPDGAVRR